MTSVLGSTAHESSRPSPIHIAIAGGGIGGLCLMLGLLKHPHIDVNVYEAAPTFSEFGAGVEIGPNAQWALELLGPEAEKAFVNCTTTNLHTSHATVFLDYIVGKGEHEGRNLCAQKCATGMQSMHRARFLDQLVQALPPNRAHLNKRIINIEDSERNGVILHFQDGTSATTDAVVGADGIRSFLREHLLGKGMAQPFFTGSIAYRNIASMEQAIEKMGSDWMGKATILCGPKGGILSDRIEGGKMTNLAAVVLEVDGWEHKESHVPATGKELRSSFAGWGEKAQALLDLMDNPNLSKWAIFEHRPASTYARGRVAIMGDAAHASTPYQGAGAGQAIEDALILETVLGKITHPAQLSNALKAFDAVRRPRSQKCVRTSMEAGEIIGMKPSLVGNPPDLKRIEGMLETRMNWLWDVDMPGECQKAVEIFEGLCKENGD